MGVAAAVQQGGVVVEKGDEHIDVGDVRADHQRGAGKGGEAFEAGLRQSGAGQGMSNGIHTTTERSVRKNRKRSKQDRHEGSASPRIVGRRGVLASKIIEMQIKAGAATFGEKVAAPGVTRSARSTASLPH